MPKKEMKKQLDIVMLNQMTRAVWCADQGYKDQAVKCLDQASGVMLSASILELLTDEEFSNINHTLSHTHLKW